MSDPTAFDLGGDLHLSDPRVRRLNAYTRHGHWLVTAPFMTQVAENLWQGGVEPGLIMPSFVDYHLSLYQWQNYEINHDLKESKTVEMYDSLSQEFDQVDELAQWVHDRRQKGVVLVNCQAGLNRSSLVVAAALILGGDVDTGQEAIDLIRSRRDMGCLCNPSFEKYVQGLGRLPYEGATA